MHRLSDTLIHLMRGQVFELEGYTFFTFGGGFSIDRAYLENQGISWWEEEIRNLKEYDNKVDFVLTHDCPTSLEENVSIYTWKSIKPAKSNEALETFLKNLSFTHWYF